MGTGARLTKLTIYINMCGMVWSFRGGTALTDKTHDPAAGHGPVRSRLRHAGAVGIVVLLGLGVRHPGLGLPWPLAKYGGSILWGTMVYFIVAVAVPRIDISRRAGAAALLALLVELIRLYHVPWLDAFRVTTAGGLLLGRFFSVWNILAYWIGILGGAVVDARTVRRRATRGYAASESSSSPSD
jgi:hypothetical protein